MFFEDDKFKEECGVFAIYSKDQEIPAASYAYYGLYALQHRGQESAGIVVNQGGKLSLKKGMGLVSEVFNEKELESMRGKAAIGHVRYSTTGDSRVENAQPLVSEFKLGSISIAHNGNLVNTDVLRELLEDSGSTFQTSIDSEVILKMIARQIKKGIERAVTDTMDAIKGSYGIVILTKDQLIGIRDPHGIRPLCLGLLDGNYVIASESCALDAIGAELVRDIEPGEVVIIDDNGLKSIKKSERTTSKICAFELIYFARPDSVMEKIPVHEARFKAGELLYKDYPVEADIVVGVPDSGMPAAMGYAKASGIPFGMGLVKNKYIGRTFIAPTQELREKAVSVKLNALKCNVEGKRVVLIDDSIVRGTTSKRLVELLRKAGAKEIHFRSASPVVKYPCYFGIDIAYRRELVGATMSVDEINNMIGSDTLGYLKIERLLEALGGENKYCLGCFNGIYPMSAPSDVEKDRYER
ncbi:MAG: amidophosphoribosyltransferase [Clostridiaceae bacterium]